MLECDKQKLIADIQKRIEAIKNKLKYIENEPISQNEIIEAKAFYKDSIKLLKKQLQRVKAY